MIVTLPRYAGAAGIRIAILAMAMALCAATSAGAQSVAPAATAPPAHEQLGEAWWTGPLLAPGAGTLPHGHLLVEPYVYDVMQYGTYGANGRVGPATHTQEYGSLTYVIYGVTDRLSAGVIPTFGYTTAAGGPNSNGVGAGDTSLTAQYRLALYQPGHFTPTTSVAVEETFPTGRYDALGDNANNGFGGGVYSTKVSLYTQSFAWLGNGRIVRMRLNVSQTFSGGAPVDGVSVYGTGSGFHGWAKPGGTLTIDAAGEYSITRSWVFASDVVYGFSGNTLVGSGAGVNDLGDSHTLALAPAVEYNWTPDVGIIFGVRVFPSARNAPASVTPVAAIDIVH
jgi:hypothetical protein